MAGTARSPRRLARARGLAAAALALPVALGACSPAPEPPAAASCPRLTPPARPPRGIVFVLADTLRRDRLGAYGGEADTPAFDRLAREHLLFENAVSQAPWTKPSVATLFTGVLPSRHGVLSDPSLKAAGDTAAASEALAPSWVTLAEAFRAAGWDTAAFVANPWISRELGFDQGFATYEQGFAANTTPGTAITKAGLAWLRGRPADAPPFLLYLHYMDPHAPYPPIPGAVLDAHREALESPGETLPPKQVQVVVKEVQDVTGLSLVAEVGMPASRLLLALAYDQGVERFDRALGALRAGLEAQGLAGDVALVVTSDHGEALLDHGWWGHGHGLHADEAAVPLAAALPGVEADGRIDCPVGLVDLRRTLCDYAGIPCTGDQGHSLFRDTPSQRPPLLTEGVIARPRNRAARADGWALLFEPDGRAAEPHRQGGPSALFHAAADPDETRNLLAAEPLPPDARSAEARLRARIEEAAGTAPPAEPETVPLDEDTRRRLEALGYGAGGDADD